jgi:preprotein translocase subunit SecF
MLKIIEKTKIWFTASAIIIVIGLAFMGIHGLQYDIEFKGGTLVQVDMEKDFDATAVKDVVVKYAPDAEVKKAISDGKYEVDITSGTLTSDKIDALVKDIKTKFNLKSQNPLISQSNIGPSIGNEVRTKAVLAVVLANIAILIYIGFRFELKFGVAAILALVHDVLITLAVYAIFQIPIGSGFLAAMLTVIGYSMSDTIVVFDRIRENMKKTRKHDYTEIADVSITQTMTRSINTVATTLICITSVYFCVPSVRDFAFPLIIGIISGCYSSVFIASPFWVLLRNMGTKKAALR